jgi:hypothetical protein
MCSAQDDGFVGKENAKWSLSGCDLLSWRTALEANGESWHAIVRLSIGCFIKQPLPGKVEFSAVYEPRGVGRSNLPITPFHGNLYERFDLK